MGEHFRPPDHRPEGHARIHSPTREHGVFVARRHAAIKGRRESRERQIPEMHRRAGKIVRTLRTTTTEEEIPVQVFGNCMGVSNIRVNEFERGERNLDLSMVYLTAKGYFHNESEEMSEEMRELRTIKKFVSEDQLLRILSQDSMTIGKAINLLRLSELMSPKEIANAIDMRVDQLSTYLVGKKHPTSNTLNRILGAIGANPDDLSIQMIHLLRAGEEPMSLDKLKACSFGELMKYLRLLKGVTQSELVEELHYTNECTIEQLENDEFIPPPNTVSNFSNWLKIKTESSLAKIIVSKVKNPEKSIEEATLNGVLTEKYLFGEHLQNLGQANLSSDETEFMQNIDSMESVNKMVRFMLEKKEGEQSLRKFSDKIKTPTMTVQNATEIAGLHIPKDTTLVRIVMGLGYGIFHPITQFLLTRLYQDNAYRTYAKNLAASESIYEDEDLERVA